MNSFRTTSPHRFEGGQLHPLTSGSGYFVHIVFFYFVFLLLSNLHPGMFNKTNLEMSSFFPNPSCSFFAESRKHRVHGLGLICVDSLRYIERYSVHGLGLICVDSLRYIERYSVHGLGLICVDSLRYIERV